MNNCTLVVFLFGVILSVNLRLVAADSDPAPAWYYAPYCSETPVYHGWSPTSLLNGNWSLVRFAAPYTTNTLPLPNCGRIEITGSSNETKTWTVSIENDGSVVTSVKNTKVTSLEISSGRWVVSDYGVFTRDQGAMKELSSLLLLGYTRNYPQVEYDSILFASCTYIQYPMGQPLNRIGEFGILVRQGTEALFNDEYFRAKYSHALEIAQLGTVDDMESYSHDECASL